MRTCRLAQGETLWMGSKWFLWATNRNRAFYSTSYNHLLKSNDTLLMKCTLKYNTCNHNDCNHHKSHSITQLHTKWQHLNENPTNLAPSALRGWLCLREAEDSALFLCSPVSCLPGGEEGEVEHSHDTTFVTSHTASLQRGAFPLEQTKPCQKVSGKATGVQQSNLCTSK